MGGSFPFDERHVDWLRELGKWHAREVASVTYAMHEEKLHEKVIMLQLMTPYFQSARVHLLDNRQSSRNRQSQ